MQGCAGRACASHNHRHAEPCEAVLTGGTACMDKQLQDGSVIALRRVAKSSRQLAGGVAQQILGCRQLKGLASCCHVPRALCRNVVHRDLKLENLLLASPDEITKVRRVLLWHVWHVWHGGCHTTNVCVWACSRSRFRATAPPHCTAGVPCA